MRLRLERHLGTIIEEMFQERMTPEFPPHGALTQQNVPGATPAQNQNQRVDLVDQHKQELLNGIVDTRTKLLDSYFFLIYFLILLHFLTYIQFLCAL